MSLILLIDPSSFYTKPHKSNRCTFFVIAVILDVHGTCSIRTCSKKCRLSPMKKWYVPQMRTQINKLKFEQKQGQGRQNESET